MTELFFRRVALAVVFAAGVVSIMATSYPPDHYFEETNIQPALRCPGANVVLGWRLNEPAPVSVTVDDQEFRMAGHDTKLTLSASIFDRTDSPTGIVLRVDRPDFDYPEKYDIRTLRHESWVSTSAFQTGDTGFTLNQGSGVWDHRIEVRGLEIMDVQHLNCTDGERFPRSWQVTAPSGKMFVLRAGENFERRLDPGVPAGGKWKLRPENADCRAVPSGLQPEINIRLTAVCRQPDKSY